jgi:hypothetical protein
MSDREIGRVANVDHKTVLKLRKDIICIGDFPNANATTKPIKPGRVAKDGRRYPASRAKLINAAATMPRNRDRKPAGESNLTAAV